MFNPEGIHASRLANMATSSSSPHQLAPSSPKVPFNGELIELGDTPPPEIPGDHVGIAILLDTPEPEDIPAPPPPPSQPSTSKPETRDTHHKSHTDRLSNNSSTFAFSDPTICRNCGEPLGDQMDLLVPCVKCAKYYHAICPTPAVTREMRYVHDARSPKGETWTCGTCERVRTSVGLKGPSGTPSDFRSTRRSRSSIDSETRLSVGRGASFTSDGESNGAHKTRRIGMNGIVGLPSETSSFKRLRLSTGVAASSILDGESVRKDRGISQPPSVLATPSFDWPENIKEGAFGIGRTTATRPLKAVTPISISSDDDEPMTIPKEPTVNITRSSPCKTSALEIAKIIAPTSDNAGISTTNRSMSVNAPPTIIIARMSPRKSPAVASHSHTPSKFERLNRDEDTRPSRVRSARVRSGKLRPTRAASAISMTDDSGKSMSEDSIIRTTRMSPRKLSPAANTPMALRLNSKFATALTYNKGDGNKPTSSLTAETVSELESGSESIGIPRRSSRRSPALMKSVHMASTTKTTPNSSLGRAGSSKSQSGPVIESTSSSSEDDEYFKTTKSLTRPKHLAVRSHFGNVVFSPTKKSQGRAGTGMATATIPTIERRSPSEPLQPAPNSTAARLEKSDSGRTLSQRSTGDVSSSDEGDVRTIRKKSQAKSKMRNSPDLFGKKSIRAPAFSENEASKSRRASRSAYLGEAGQSSLDKDAIRRRPLTTTSAKMPNLHVRNEYASTVGTSEDNALLSELIVTAPASPKHLRGRTANLSTPERTEMVIAETPLATRSDSSVPPTSEHEQRSTFLGMFTKSRGERGVVATPIAGKPSQPKIETTSSTPEKMSLRVNPARIKKVRTLAASMIVPETPDIAPSRTLVTPARGIDKSDIHFPNYPFLRPGTKSTFNPLEPPTNITIDYVAIAPLPPNHTPRVAPRPKDKTFHNLDIRRVRENPRSLHLHHSPNPLPPKPSPIGLVPQWESSDEGMDYDDEDGLCEAVLLGNRKMIKMSWAEFIGLPDNLVPVLKDGQLCVKEGRINLRTGLLDRKGVTMKVAPKPE